MRAFHTPANRWQYEYTPESRLYRKSGARFILAPIDGSRNERLKVGCLLVKDNRIISQGYNGFLPGCPHESIVRDDHEQATLHAEQNALCDCAKRGVSCDESIAYITHYPCLICARLLIAAGVVRIYYLEDYRNDALVAYFTQQKGVIIQRILD